MIETYTLQTTEADIIEDALSDIKSQLSAIKLRRSSIGLAICHYDFVSNGVVEAISNALPFPVVGITTFNQVTNTTKGLFLLTFTVLTSDDVTFAAAGSTLPDAMLKPEERIQKAYDEAFAIHGKKPSLILAFLSMIRPITGDAFLRQLDEVSGGVPCFGAVTTGDNDDGQNTFVIANGQAFSEGYAMVLITGEIEPHFFFGNFYEERLVAMSARATKVDGPLLCELNNMPATVFMEKNGVAINDDARKGLVTIPFMYKMPGDDVMIARTMGDYTEDGSAVLFGEVPEGAIFRAGLFSTEDILRKTRDVAKAAAEECPDATFFLMFSCVGRYISLGLDTDSELNGAAAQMPNNSAYLACYTSGEICPVINHGEMLNRYHNSSFVVCAIK